MKTLLIAEDEKMIRQGLKTMVQRSGVEVDEILECKNGEEALAILQQRPVDILFTDIRMPKMDGLALLNALKSCDASPEIVVISGYDDFSYAVEALKCGAREYILKPVNREDIYKVMTTLEDIVTEKNQMVKKLEAIEDILEQQIKYILLNPDITNDELKKFQKGFANHWINEEKYRLFCSHEPIAVPEKLEVMIYVVEDHHILICKESDKHDLKKVLQTLGVGISDTYSGIMHLRIAYEQSWLARKYAYMMNKEYLQYEEIPLQQKKRVDYKLLEKLIQLIGTERTKEMGDTFKQVLGDACISEMIYEDFEKLMQKLLEYMMESYGSFIHPGEFQQVKGYYKYPTYEVYKVILKIYLEALGGKIHASYESGKNNEEMKAALAYIHENYDKDLNMAMVSNHISMNYSCFSQVFKEYTGMNFVNYIKEIRINKAKELLANTSHKVAEIGYAVGFENEKHFMKVFKSVTGISPTEYRKNSILIR